MESILNWVKFKAQTQLNKKCSSVKHSKIKGIPKLDDANDAGETHKHHVILFWSVKSQVFLLELHNESMNVETHKEYEGKIIWI